ncbi:MAG: HDOD domain-containing protein [Pseudomonadales bacterium]|jgi:HD-like signal output (HDOD) protein|nr:HDOD domain-containing protein [Pseudomonadales bacterium]
MDGHRPRRSEDRAPATTPEHLKRLLPLRLLGAGDLEALAGTATARRLEADAVLRARDERDQLLWLLEGELVLGGPERSPTRLVAGSEPARRPVFWPRTGYVAARARGPARLLALDAGRVRALFRDAHAPCAAGSGAKAPADGRLGALAARLEAGAFEVPAMPEVAVRIRGRLAKPGVTVAALAELARLDPGLSGHLLQAANSPVYGGRARARTVPEALERLGLGAGRSVVTAIALHHLLEPADPALRARGHALWARSVDLGAGAHALARVTERVDPERALLAGVLHRVGALVLLGLLGDEDASVPAAEVDRVLAVLGRRAGERVLERWDLGADLRDVVRHWNAPEADAGPESACRELVQVAALLLDGADEGAVIGHPAFKRSGLPADNIDQLRVRVEAHQAVLCGLLGR